jgi:predicted phosphodiesterase
VRTLIVSDLHLGSLSGADVLRRPELRGRLIEELAEVDRLVLLGDVLELRHGPLRDAMAAARPVFEDLGRALAGRELVLVAGNHDHALIDPWLLRRGEEKEPPPLGLEQLLEPEEASPAYARIAAWAAPSRVLVAYPGLWLREDVYATHGHYLDSHLTVPTLERLSVGVMARVLGRGPEEFDSIADYEAVGAPVFAWRDVIARDARTGAVLNGLATVGAWRALNRSGSRAGRSAARRPAAGGSTSERYGGSRNGRAGLDAGERGGVRARISGTLPGRAVAVGFPIAVELLNRAGIGPLRADVSPGELRRAGLRAMGEVAARLGLGDAFVVFGHTHRSGPLPGDDLGEWHGRGGARLVNAGSWTYSPIFLGRRPVENPPWPGVGILVEDAGEPRLIGLLRDLGPEQLRPQRAAAAQR